MVSTGYLLPSSERTRRCDVMADTDHLSRGIGAMAWVARTIVSVARANIPRVSKDLPPISLYTPKPRF